MQSFETISASLRQHLCAYVLSIADDRLILGHRLSEWCGHGPFLEEDIAQANIALDLIGQANSWLELAGNIEGRGRSADDLAYHRDTVQFRNAQLVERPRGDFAETVARQFLFDSYSVLLLEGLTKSSCKEIAALAAKCIKEDIYHLRHSRQWMLRLGDGTEESHQRLQLAFNDYWRYSGELFEADTTFAELYSSGLAVDPSSLHAAWRKNVESCLCEATLVLPDASIIMATGSRNGTHSEYLDHLLTEMQSLPRSHPGATW